MRFNGSGPIRIENDLLLVRKFLWRPLTIQGQTRWLEWSDFWVRPKIEVYEHYIGGNESETCERTVWEPVKWSFIRIPGDD